MNFRFGMFLAFVAVAAVAIMMTFQHPPVKAKQWGYRGVAMVQVRDPADIAKVNAVNLLPSQDQADTYKAEDYPPAGHPAKQDYKNVQVLGDIDSNEFNRVMSAITAWVAPTQGCGYCHGNSGNFASDDLYQKRVARKMIQMVQNINGNFKQHVVQTGVTCWTCHRGNPVPANVWYFNPGPPMAQGMLGDRTGMSSPLISPGGSSLPYDPFTPFLDKAKNIRVASTTALPYQDRSSIKQTEWTYALMMHFSTALGVNCTFCHNTRSFSSWELSTPQRVNAWWGIRMVRNVNNGYLETLKGVFPETRLGSTGDVAKVNCTTCHQGLNKPLNGVSMLGSFAELASEHPPKVAEAPPAATPAAAPAVAAPPAAAPPAATPPAAAPPAAAPPAAAPPAAAPPAAAPPAAAPPK